VGGGGVVGWGWLWVVVGGQRGGGAAFAAAS